MDPNTPQQPQTQPQPTVQQPTPQVVAPPPQAPQTPERNRALEFVVPINRSGWSIAAGYVALFNIPFFVTAPFALLLGIVGLVDLSKHPTRAGRGRCWFAIIYSAAVMIFIAVAVILSTTKH